MQNRGLAQNRGMVYLALVIIALGVLLLLSELINFNAWAICFPVALILLGAFVLLRPRFAEPGTNSRMTLFGDYDHAGPGELAAEEFFGLIIDATYDLTKFDIPSGETVIRGYSFISDIEIYVPADVGVEVTAASFVTEFKLAGEKEQTYFLSPYTWKSDGYKMMERRVRFEITQFIGDVKVRVF